MAKFLNTSATNYFLEELMKAARERLIIVSPYLKLNDRIRELLQDKDRMKIDVRIVYGKNDLAPHEISWLKSLDYVRTSFCQNLHAKCYLNEQSAIITSMNLYEFSQVNNNEMGVFISREEESDLYRETYEEVQRLIRISDEVRLSAETVAPEKPKATRTSKTTKTPQAKDSDADKKLPTSKIARSHGLKTAELITKLEALGLIEVKGEQQKLTAKGEQVGGETRVSKQYGQYFLWPTDIKI